VDGRQGRRAVDKEGGEEMNRIASEEVGATSWKVTRAVTHSFRIWIMKFKIQYFSYMMVVLILFSPLCSKR
jgi:hypothetical protein